MSQREHMDRYEAHAVTLSAKAEIPDYCDKDPSGSELLGLEDHDQLEGSR